MADMELLLGHLEGVRRKKDTAMALCPAHSDMSHSLSIRQSGDRVLINCFAGCSALGILTAVGLDWSALMPEDGEYKPIHRRSRSDQIEVAESLLELVPLWIEAGRKFSAKDKEDIISAKLLVIRSEK
tara:strand:+ start:2812 stop:3195 length:384 start_codon:yes stop_codon:yes gene_type:complete